MYKDSVFLRQATLADIDALEQLLNRCYRQKAGWTNEADLIGGIRTTAASLAAVINDPCHYFFVYPKTTTGKRDGDEVGELLGCINVEIKMDTDLNESLSYQGVDNSAYIGMFAVLPEQQGRGVGHQILQAAETFAKHRLKSDSTISDNKNSRLTMSILSHRPELLAYYERRGYQLSGHKIAFPNDGNNGEPKRDDLELLELEKVVS